MTDPATTGFWSLPLEGGGQTRVTTIAVPSVDINFRMESSATFLSDPAVSSPCQDHNRCQASKVLWHLGVNFVRCKPSVFLKLTSPASWSLT